MRAMFDRVRRVRRNWLVPACLAILLVTVLAGLLQFRGINRMSDAVRRQRRGDVERTLRNFRGDFRATLLQPLPFFRPPPDDRNDILLESWLVENARRWHSNSDRPQLLASISIGTQSKEGVVFRRLSTGEDQFKRADWPHEFMGYRRILDERASSSGILTPPLSTGAILTLFQGTAVLIFPIVTGASPIPASRRFTGWCFLEFDRAYLREHLLPELVARHFAGARTQGAIVAREPLNLIYALEPTLTIESLAQVDAGVVLLEANLAQDLQKTLPPMTDAPPIVSGSPGVPLAEIAGGQGGTGAWVLVVKSQAGSYEELIEYWRQHAVGLNFWMLVLLAGTSVMLMLASLRARRLAQQQIEFVAGVSHELRTPLTVIQSTSYNLSQGTIKDPSRVQQYGDVIQREARRLINQIERMLSFAGIQSGRRIYDLQPTNVTEIAERSLAEYAGAFAEAGWQIEQHFAEDLPSVLTDGPALESALKNLFDNALKYAAQGKWLSVSARAATERKRKEVQVTVADRGPGIAPEDLPHIFKPFYRGQSRGQGEAAATTSGAGLGLCLVERTLGALGGSVTVQSAPGKGTSFTLHLPAN
jgi:signal transduction histidine kinase